MQCPQRRDARPEVEWWASDSELEVADGRTEGVAGGAQAGRFGAGADADADSRRESGYCCGGFSLAFLICDGNPLAVVGWIGKCRCVDEESRFSSPRAFLGTQRQMQMLARAVAVGGKERPVSERT